MNGWASDMTYYYTDTGAWGLRPDLQTYGIRRELVEKEHPVGKSNEELMEYNTTPRHRPQNRRGTTK